MVDNDNNNTSSTTNRRESQSSSAELKTTSNQNSTSGANNNNNNNNSNNNNNNSNSNSNSNNNNNNNNTNSSSNESYNPRWKGYVILGLTSLINFLSIATLNKENLDYWGISLAFGLWTFLLCLTIVLQDRSQLYCQGKFHLAKGVEGWTLVGCVGWWFCGVGYQTSVDGIAYHAHNIYYSSWASLAACIYTFNQWSAAHDLLSWEEMTGLSLTLKSWYTCWFSSCVVFFTCVDLHTSLEHINLDDASFGIGLGVLSSLIAAFFILVHYNFIPSVVEGGWLELSSSFFLILLWTIGLAVMTQDRGIAATLSGTQCKFQTISGNAVAILQQLLALQDDDHINNNDDDDAANSNCVISYQVENQDTGTMEMVQLPCSQLLSPSQNETRGGLPGSNLYFAAWICFFSSLNVTFRWKAAQALQFAQAQQEREQKRFQQQEEADSDGPHFSDSADEEEDDTER
jgi:hypothetical protein